MEARDLSRERPRPFELALRIRHPSMDPSAISGELHLEPDHCFCAGEPRESASGLAATTRHAESYWLARLDSASMQPLLDPSLELLSSRPQLADVTHERMRSLAASSLGAALAVATTRLLRTHADFVRRVQAEGGEVALIVELTPAGSQSFTLTPQVAKVLCDLGVCVEFEFTGD